MNQEEKQELVRKLHTLQDLYVEDGYQGFAGVVYETINLIEKQEKTINEMAEYIKYRTGSCPLDLEDCEIKFCDSECSMKIINKCWIEYFTKKVGE